ncbi:Vibriobactin utilization protein ViuB [compost metagenome]
MTTATSLVSSFAQSLRTLVAGSPRNVRPYQVFDIELKQRVTLSPSLTRLVFTGADVNLMQTLAPDQRVKLLFPAADGSLPALPKAGDWQAARRSLAPQQQPPMRSYTIRALRAEHAELDIDFVLHGETGPASAWATHAQPGARLQIVAPHRFAGKDPGGYEWQPPLGAQQVLLIGDETALPAIAGILETLADHAAGPQVQAFIEVPHAADCLPLRCAPGTQLHWLPRDALGFCQGDAIVHAAKKLAQLPLPADSHRPVKGIKDIDIDKKRVWEKAETTRSTFYAWVAGESMAVMTIRKYLINERGLDRKALTLMGYWRQGRVLD